MFISCCSLSIPELNFTPSLINHNSQVLIHQNRSKFTALSNKVQSFGQRDAMQLGSSSKPRIRNYMIQSFEHVNTLPFSDYKFSRMKLFKPRYEKSSLFSGDSLKSSNFNGSTLRSEDLGCGESERNRDFALMAKTVMSVDNLVEIGGNEGMSRGADDYDAIVIGSGIGGLVAATQLAVKGARVLVLEKYVIPGGSSGYYERDGYTFDVGSSVMFGFSDKGNLNLITQALAAVGCEMEVIPDPTTVHFHLPNDLSVRVHREYSDFVAELTSKFPHEKEGVLAFYGECWKIFNALNSLELKSLEEPIYLFGQFFKRPLECLTLAYYLPQNAGNIARKYIKDPQLLSFIDAECFIVSTINALQTPMINASMVLCDRHFGGINYPVGGVGGIAKSLAKGLADKGSEILYKANVTKVILEHGKAVGVRLSDGREFYAKTIISNATRWDTFGKLLKGEQLPKEEENFQKLYVKAPSFLSIHMGVKAEVLPPDTDCHHFVLEDDWNRLEEPYGSIFLSIPTVLDSSLAPEGQHILHIFTICSIEDWEGLAQKDYDAKKELVADEIINRLENKLFPGLKQSIAFREIGSPKTHRRYLARDQGTYGPMPRGTPKGLLGMPFNTTGINGLYCVGDSCFPGQGVIAVAFSGVMCAHRVAADIGLEKKSPVLDAGLLRLLAWLRSMA
ncbi:prolycopene isomerase [Citrus sinensis]|uniref:prolycopene isomerase n=4 Tax=Citrus TaxID=2706 RepID=A0A075QU08_CITUN|nr:prolycopene isomerase, chloroplastic [Citrus sinensis]AIG20207.1 carotenoid isomerase [Citrus unshiu]KAH9674210.1 prolycopene isomerase [Citrus sinensis]